MLTFDDLESGRFIVCERAHFWAARIRPKLSNMSLRLYESRSLAECWQQLETAPASLLALELTATNIKSMIEALPRMTRWYPLARAVILGDRVMLEFDWLLREAGAVGTTFSPRRLDPLMRLVERHFASIQARAQTTSGCIRLRLPWTIGL